MSSVSCIRNTAHGMLQHITRAKLDFSLGESVCLHCKILPAATHMTLTILQAEAAAKVSKLQKEKEFLAQTSDSLLRNQDDFRTQLATEQAKVKARDAQVAELTEQVWSAFALLRTMPAFNAVLQCNMLPAAQNAAVQQHVDLERNVSICLYSCI